MGELDRIRDRLFQGSAEYTKSHPDLFLPGRYEMLAPSLLEGFDERFRASLDSEEILIYVHLPYCFTECLFCNSFPKRVHTRDQRDYIEALLTEIDMRAERGLFDERKARCIYLGGGTPTSFSDDQLERLLRSLGSHVAFSSSCSITCEAHPRTLTDPHRIEVLASLGIDRISIGCQTFDARLLALCNRTGSKTAVHDIVQRAAELQVSTSVDMMTGLPGQTLEGVQRDLEILDGIRPDAVEYIRHEIVNPSVIDLYRWHPELLVDDESLFQMVCTSHEWLESSGYEQNGRYSSPEQWGYRYHWLREMPIVAFGARARSYTPGFIVDNHEDISTYMLAIRKGLLPTGRYVELSARDRMYRTFLLNLQLSAGIDRARFRQKCGTDPLTEFHDLIAVLDEIGCLEIDDACICLSRYGAWFVEDVCDLIVEKAQGESSAIENRIPHSQGSTSSRLPR